MTVNGLRIQNPLLLLVRLIKGVQIVIPLAPLFILDQSVLKHRYRLVDRRDFPVGRQFSVDKLQDRFLEALYSGLQFAQVAGNLQYVAQRGARACPCSSRRREVAGDNVFRGLARLDLGGDGCLLLGYQP